MQCLGMPRVWGSIPLDHISNMQAFLKMLFAFLESYEYRISSTKTSMYYSFPWPLIQRSHYVDTKSITCTVRLPL